MQLPKVTNNPSKTPEDQTQSAAQVVDMEGEELELVEVEESDEELDPRLLEIVRLIGKEGKSLRTALEVTGVCWDTWYRGLEGSPRLSGHYARAQGERAALLVEQAQELAMAATGLDSAGVNAKKLQVDTLKWFASKLDPKRYGDYQRTEITQSEGGDVAGEAQRLLRLRKKGAVTKPTKPKA